MKVKVATQTEQEFTGKEEKGWPVVEAGMGEIKREGDPIPGGWELIWVEDSWTGKREKVRVPREQADYRRRQGLPKIPSYWRELEAREWRRRLREEKEVVAREEQERLVWRMEEARRREYLDPF